MPKNYLNVLIILALGLGLAGCGTGGSGLQVRSYVEDKPRVNMEITGNQGYLMGTPPPVDRSDQKKTRKVYVLEISKPADIEEGQGTIDENASASMTDDQTTSSRSSSYSEDISQGESQNTDALSFSEYKVEKDDTLQKISKKFYDTYKKWPKIYDANKEKIKDPNHIKPGIVLKIPRE